MPPSSKAPKKSQATGQKKPTPKNTRSRGLPSPSPTPAVEDGRVQADEQRRLREESGLMNKDGPTDTTSEDPNEAENELERVLGCKDDAYADILNIKDGDDATEAWQQLGCLLHMTYCKLDQAEVAYQKLKKAATEMNVEERFIGEVDNWNGEDDLQAADDSEDQNDEESPAMDVDVFPEPPVRVTNLYEKATVLLRDLTNNQENPTALAKLKVINDTIVRDNKAQNAQTANESEHIPDQQWIVPIEFFTPHYKILSRTLATLQSNPEDEGAQKEFQATKDVINEEVRRKLFPAGWTIKGLEDCLKNLESPGEGASPAAEEPTQQAPQSGEGAAVKSQPKLIEYPWRTGEAADGSLIIGVRQQGRWGTQVCTERVEDGRFIRRLEAASDVGLLEVDDYKTIKGHKVLSEGQSAWSSKDRGDFIEVLWVTKSQIQRKNTAANSKDPPADCCVKFNRKGINILTVSSLSKVLGAASARAQIDKVCREDGIPPPWKAGWVSEYNDPAKVEKDPTRRRALKDVQAHTSSVERRSSGRRRGRRASVSSSGSNSEAEQIQDYRMEALEDQVKTLTTMMTSLAETLKEVLKGQGNVVTTPSS